MFEQREQKLTQPLDALNLPTDENPTYVCVLLIPPAPQRRTLQSTIDKICSCYTINILWQSCTVMFRTRPDYYTCQFSKVSCDFYLNNAGKGRVGKGIELTGVEVNIQSTISKARSVLLSFSYAYMLHSAHTPYVVVYFKKQV